MKSIKKFLAMLLCMALIMSSFSACKKSDNNTDQTGNEPKTTDSATPTQAQKELVEIDYSQPVNYTYWLGATPNDYYSSYSDNPGVWYLNQKFNMNLKFEQPAAGTESDALSLLFGTGEYTDLIDSSYYTGSISELYVDGVIINIADYLDYMPNFKKLLDTDEGFRKNSQNDQGQILKLPFIISENDAMWGGLVYRRDILEAMTGGKVQFPSGNDTPTTIEDWDYMLPLMKQYFEASGMKDYAVLIIPALGYFVTSNLANSFGVNISYYQDKGTVKYGPMEQGFYNYLKKINEWYEAGYIYKDFASRSSDLFYLPNTALTYGGGAGIWFGLESQLGGALSLPDYGLTVDIQAMPDPIDTATGVTAAPNYSHTDYNEQYGGPMISSTCENVERLLATMDFLYSEEGSLLKGYGLDKEHSSADNEILKNNGLADGTYSITEDGTFSYNSILDVGGGSLAGEEWLRPRRLPGLENLTYKLPMLSKEKIDASDKWTMYQDTKMNLPVFMSRSIEEDETYTTNQSNIDDYVNTMVLKFILGAEELNEQSWADYKAQLEAFGIQDNIEIQQAAYERYQTR